MELRDLAKMVWKWLWLILLAMAVAGAASWLVVKDQPPVYGTSTTLMIGGAIQQVNPSYADFYTSQQLGQTYSELVKREPILKATARALGFEERWQSLQGRVATRLIEGTQLMEITVTGNDPEQVKLIADEVARQLIATVESARPKDSNRAFIEAQAATLPPKIEAAQEEIVKLEAELGAAFSAREIQDLQSRINTLEGQVSSWQATFAQYQLLLGDTGANVLTVLEEAPLPVYPAGSGLMTQVVLAAVIGGVLALGAAFLLEYMDDTLKSAEDLEKASGLHTLGLITRIPGDSPSDKLIAARHPRAPVSEAYRTLRTGLRFSMLDRPLKSLVITSSSAQEGKSTVAANLAVVLAQDGNSVVLVDADMRRPMLHRFFELPNKTGLTDALMDGSTSPQSGLQESGIPNLRIMTSGPIPPNPSELLGSPRMQRFIEEIKKGTDVMIFDTPPVLPVTDAAVLAPLTDGVLLVAEAGRTRKGALQRTVERLRYVDTNILGMTLNRLPTRGVGYYQYYYYYYTDNTGHWHKRKRKHSSTSEQAGETGKQRRSLFGRRLPGRGKRPTPPA